LFRQSEHRNEASDKPRAAEWLGLDLGAMSLASLEEKAIVASLERSKGNKVEAARRLGITRQTLYNKLKTLGIEVRRDIRKT
jgi:two-component system response regulator HydG